MLEKASRLSDVPVTYLNTPKDGNDIITVKDPNITCPDGVLPGLHPHVGPVSDIRRELLRTTHRVPSMVDEHLVLRIGCIIGIHDKPRQVAKAVNPERIAVEVSRGCLELDTRGSFVLITVQNYLPNRSEVVVVVNQGSEELVNHSSLHAVGVSAFCALLESIDASLDQVRMPLPLQLQSFGVEELDHEGSVVEDLLALSGNRVDLDLGLFLCPVCGSSDTEELLSGPCNERLCNSHVRNIKTSALQLRLVLLNQVLPKSLGNVRVE